MMRLSPSTFYYRPKGNRLEKEKRDADLRHEIERVHCKLPRSGYRTMQEYLQREGVKVGERRLRRVMKLYGLQAKVKRKFIRTTDSKHGYKIYPNLLSGMEITNVNQVWVSDITYIRILNGFVFLAVILDVYSRKVIGWSISKEIDRHLTLSALEMAIDRRKPPEGVIHHSDRGVQYLCNDYIALLIKHCFKISCSRKGNPYDNAFCESFMKTLKYNEVDLKRYETMIDVLENVPQFIEEVYNEQRVHSSLDYLTPNEFEKKIEKEMKGDNNTNNSRPVLKL